MFPVYGEIEPPPIDIRTYVRYNYYIAILVTCGHGSDGMDYMKMIVEMLDRASTLQLERLYHFIKAFLG